MRLRSLSARTATGVARWTGLSRGAQQVAVFTAAVVVLGDLVMVGVEAASATLVDGRGPRLDGWDAAKAGLVALALLGLAVRHRSRALGVFGVGFAVLGLEDQLAWHASLGAALAVRWDLGGPARWIGVPESAVGEFLVLSAAGLGGLVVARVLWDRRPGPRRAQRTLVVLLVLLMAFAVGMDVLTAGAGEGSTAALVEEMGERLVLSMTLGFTIGLVTTRR